MNNSNYNEPTVASLDLSNPGNLALSGYAPTYLKERYKHFIFTQTEK